MVYRPGTIVAANFRNFRGEEVVGLFMVLYDEELDTYHNYKKNVVVAKVTTTYSMINSRVCALDGVKFLDKDSMVVPSKIHTIDKSSIFRVIGELPPREFRGAYKQTRGFIQEMERQMEEYI